MASDYQSAVPCRGLDLSVGRPEEARKRAARAPGAHRAARLMLPNVRAIRARPSMQRPPEARGGWRHGDPVTPGALQMLGAM